MRIGPGIDGKRAGLFAVLALVVFSAVPSFQAPDGHNFVAYYAIALLGVCLLPVHWTLQVFAGVCAASCAWLQIMVANVVPKTLSPKFFQLYISANCDFQFVLIFIGLYAVFRVLRPTMDGWLELLCWFALIEVVRVSLQRLGWDPVYVPVNQFSTITHAAGSQGNIGWSGMVLAMCAPGFFRPGRWWGLIPVGLAIVVLRSSVPALATASAIGMYAILKFSGKKRICAVLWAVFAAVLYHAFDPGTSGRLLILQKTIDISAVREAWILGYGLGSWIFLFPRPGAAFFRAHNEPLQIYFELGAAGVLALLLYARFLILRFVDGMRGERGVHASCGMAAVIVCAVCNFPFHLAGTAAIATGWLALFENQTEP